ncbi:hypothetical protein AVEN_132556-1 [Araneus ventricosus]|uniref:Uncharacterized protein n=1 Tax=Araneus ventricosus TaxID=182803 RepID=A0A4Y2L886_ARAVE|nr:hypothetical protein AVEN_132556-1 [Araneus ventricosus]
MVSVSSQTGVRAIEMARGLEKWSHLEMRAVIRFLWAKTVSASEGPPRNCPDMLSDGIILCTTMPGSILLAKLKNCRKSSSGKSYTAQIWHPILFPNAYLEQGSFQTLERHFYEARLKKLVLRSDKCIDLVIM